MEIGVHEAATQAPDDRGRGRLTVVGAVIASTTGDPAASVSGGTGHQCAPGAEPIAAAVRA